MSDRMIEVFKEINEIPFSFRKPLDDVFKKFYEIMRRYNIRKGEAVFMPYNGSPNLDDIFAKACGYHKENSDWTMAYQLFINKVVKFFEKADTWDYIPYDLKYSISEEDVEIFIRELIRKEFPDIRVTIKKNEHDNNVDVMVNYEVYHSDKYQRLIMTIKQDFLWKHNMLDYLFVTDDLKEGDHE